MERRKRDALEITDLLRRSIINGECKPRERLIETELAAKYSVSRTPVREALKHLEAVGLVQIFRNKGAIVADINPQEIREMQIVRACLEGLAAEMACNRLTPDDLTELNGYEDAMEQAVIDDSIQRFSANNDSFHMLIYTKSGNTFLLETIKALLKRSWHEPCTSWEGLGDVPQTLAGHHNILQAFQQKDAAKARQAAENHILEAVSMSEALKRLLQ